MGTKHTPGPWQYGTGKEGAVVYNADIGTIATVSDSMVDFDANARLMAAAPMLLEACKEAKAFTDLLNITSGRKTTPFLSEKLRAALTEAEA